MFVMKKIILCAFFITFTLPVFSKSPDDTYLLCKGGFNNPTAWSNAYVILREKENGLGKEALLGFRSKDISYYSSNKNDKEQDFARVEDGLTGQISMRAFDLKVSENAYSASRDDSFYSKLENKVIVGNVIKEQEFIPDYERFSINRISLRMSYEIYNVFYKVMHGSPRRSSFSCKVSTKEEFKSAVLKVVDKGWKKEIKKLKKREKTKEKVKTKI